MKYLIPLTLLIFTTTVFSNTCFKLSSEIAMENSLPEVVCIDSFALKLEIPDFPKAPYYILSIESSIGTISKTPRVYEANSNLFHVSLEKLINEDNQGACSYFKSSSVEFGFLADSKAKILSDKIQVKAVIRDTYDYCHYETHTKEYSYEQI